MEDSFTSRERQFEARFAHDQEVQFKVTAHRNRLFAHWVADQMGDGAPPDYAESLLEFAFGRDLEDMMQKAQRDLRDHGVALADTKIRRALKLCEEQSRAEVMNEAMVAASPNHSPLD